ncbi:restriction endonuclease subunit S [Phaeobacter italicus]|uniref:restriction endonuclease subunit S n=1 Tax=Phaeobacter italicus TaxID=481446 RepID=UPI001A94CF50|nr:restriction endonuclease subunit S [Phaeobacter italicus]
MSTHNDEVLADNTTADWILKYVDIGSVSAESGISETQDFVFGKAPSRARRIVRHGDVLVSTVRTYLKAIAPVIHPPKNLIASTGFAVIRPNSNLRSGFASYALRTDGYVGEIVSRSVGVSYPAINASDAVEIHLPMPTPNEQTKIAAFLDYETGKIDALIAKQERLIALLEEKRQAVISHAVTKGLHPNAPLRPSGIDWLGDVPEHWEVKRLKHLASIFGRIGFRGYTVDDIVDEGEGAIVLSPSNVKDERFSLEKRSYVSWEKYYESPEIMVSAGDILLVKTGSTFGKSTFVRSADEPMTINPQMALIKIDKKWAEFVSFFLRTALIKATIDVSNTGSGMPTMTQENLGRFPVLIAPNDETNQIVEYLNGKSEIFDALTAKAQSAITLLKERRTALISAAVTGKIDVRDWQAPARAADNSSTDLSIQDFDQVQEAIA